MTALRSSLALGLALAVVITAAALASPSASGQSPYDSVTGSVTATFPDFTTESFTVSALDGPKGPKGTIVFRSPFSAVPVAVVDVTCLDVTGREARVGGTFRTPFTYTIPGVGSARILYLGIVFRDNGTPGRIDPDELHPVVFDDRPRPPTFSPCRLDLPLFPVDHGNVVVHDAA